MLRSTIILPIVGIFAGSLLHAQTQEQKVPRVSFRNDHVSVQSIQESAPQDSSPQAPAPQAPAPQAPAPQAPAMQAPVGITSVTSQEGQRELESLAEQKQTLDTELKYARAKLEAARKRLAIETAINSTPERADKAQQDIRDWEARVKTLRAQLDQVEKELEAGTRGMETNGQPQEGLVLPGENLEVFVVEDASFNGRYPVRRGGYIILPAVGRIYVAGKSIKGAEEAVKTELQKTQLQHATVMIEKIDGADVESGPVIYLAGEFKVPRPFRIPPGTKATLVSLILSSGGVTDRADLSRVKLMRVAANKSVVEEINVQRMLAGGGLSADISLNEGDVVLIPGGEANSIFVTGNVRRQGPQFLKLGDKLSVYNAILQSGGFARFADTKNVYILRAMADGSKVKIPVNVAAVQKGQSPDIPLQGNDIVVVPEKFFSF